MATQLDPVLVAFLAGDDVATDLDQADEYLAAGRPKDAMAILSVAFYEDVDRFRAASCAARACLELRVPHESLVWARWVRGVDDELGRMLMAVAFCQLGRYEEAGAVAEGCAPERLEEVGLHASYGMLVQAVSATAVGNLGAAEAMLLNAIEAGSADPSLWAQLGIVVGRQGVVSIPVQQVVERSDVLSAVSWMGHGDAIGAELVLDALWSARPGDKVLLAVAAELAPRAPIDRAVEWSQRMRTIGLVHLCPVRSIAASESFPALERVQAAVVVAAAFGDDDGGALVRAACSGLVVEEIPTALTVVADMAMDLLEDAVNGAAQGVPESLAAARFLYDGEAVEGALAVVAHALQIAEDDPVWTPIKLAGALRSAFDPAQLDALAAGFESVGAREQAACIRALCSAL